ncbi:MAG: acylneuraminate cytidylyltransferase family protein [Bacteroidota bacterium]
MTALALIPARAGSKSVPHKNIQSVGGKPLLAYSIEQALAAERVSRVLLSTDSEDYAAIGRRFGAETPFLRTAALATDLATDLDVFRHALAWFEEHEGAVPDLIVHLRPTHPVRQPADIDAAIDLLVANPTWDSVRSVVEAPHTPYKMWTRGDDGTLTPFATLASSGDGAAPDAYNLPRQVLPTVYLQNAAIDVTRTRTIRDLGSMTGHVIGSYVMREVHDIDTPDELARAVRAVQRTAEVPTGKQFVFDIDGVIASLTPGNDYAQAEPLTDTIAVVNRLYDVGNRIVLLTARGYVTGIDWRPVTEAQLARWGVRYHELHFGKPNADYYIDDRLIAMDDLRALIG